PRSEQRPGDGPCLKLLLGDLARREGTAAKQRVAAIDEEHKGIGGASAGDLFGGSINSAPPCLSASTRREVSADGRGDKEHRAVVDLLRPGGRRSRRSQERKDGSGRPPNQSMHRDAPPHLLGRPACFPRASVISVASAGTIVGGTLRSWQPISMASFTKDS